MYVVTGATGNTGASVANALLAAGEKVRILARSEEKAAPWRARGAEVALGDIRDAASIARALEGAKGAYLMNPPDYATDEPYAQAERTADAWAEAMEASGLPHAAALSSEGGHRRDGTGIVRTLHLIETRLRAQARPVTFLRPSYFLENWGAVLEPVMKQGVLPSFLALDRPRAMVASADIGRTAAELLRDPASAHRTVELAGPRDATPLEVAAALSRLLGKPVTAGHVPREGWAGAIAALPVSAAVKEGFHGLYAGIEDGTLRFEGRPRRGTVGLDEGLKALLR